MKIYTYLLFVFIRPVRIFILAKSFADSELIIHEVCPHSTILTKNVHTGQFMPINPVPTNFQFFTIQQRIN
jgi:hypothetical protein